MRIICTMLAGAAMAMAIAIPASAQVRILASDVNFSAAPFTFGVNATDTFTFTFSPREQFDPSPVFVRTAGTAQTTAFFGAPSVFFTDPPVTFGPSIFPGFAAIPTDTRAAFTLTASDLGLRYGVEGAYYYGYARFAGSQIDRIAFESMVNTPILAGVAGAVPEPATWAIMILGFGAVGGALRARRTVRTSVAYA